MAMRKHGSTGYVHIPQQDAPSQEEIATSISPSLNATDPEIISKDIHIASPDSSVDSHHVSAKEAVKLWQKIHFQPPPSSAVLNATIVCNLICLVLISVLKKRVITL